MQTLPERLRAKTQRLLRSALDWTLSVSTTSEPVSETEEEWEQRERMRARRAAELEIWRKQEQPSDD
jgi:hypothetical protein